MPGWLKRKDGEPAVEPVKVGTKNKKDGSEVSAAFDAEGDEVYGGTFGPTHVGSIFAQGSVPAGEATLATIDAKLDKVLEAILEL